MRQRRTSAAGRRSGRPANGPGTWDETVNYTYLPASQHSALLRSSSPCRHTSELASLEPCQGVAMPTSDVVACARGNGPRGLTRGGRV